MLQAAANCAGVSEDTEGSKKQKLGKNGDVAFFIFKANIHKMHTLKPTHRLKPRLKILQATGFVVVVLVFCLFIYEMLEQVLNNWPESNPQQRLSEPLGRSGC